MATVINQNGGLSGSSSGVQYLNLVDWFTFEARASYTFNVEPGDIICSAVLPYSSSTSDVQSTCGGVPQNWYSITGTASYQYIPDSASPNDPRANNPIIVSLTNSNDSPGLLLLAGYYIVTSSGTFSISDNYNPPVSICQLRYSDTIETYSRRSESITSDYVASTDLIMSVNVGLTNAQYILFKSPNGSDLMSFRQSRLSGILFPACTGSNLIKTAQVNLVIYMKSGDLLRPTSGLTLTPIIWTKS